MTKHVIRIDDNSDHPLVGEIIGQEDEDRVVVAWGDEMYRAYPAEKIERLDDLRPRPWYPY